MKTRFVLLTLPLLLLAATVCNSLESLPTQEGTYIREAVQSAIFLYDASTKPCEAATPGRALLPLGSGFIAGFAQKGAKPLPDGRMPLYKFLVTAQHVIGSRDSIIIRLNRTDKPEFACFTLNLIRQGKDKNVYALAKRPEVDLVAASIPDFPNTDPTVLDYSLILDDELMSKYEVREGTDIFVVGYLWGYSGEKRNFAVTKFGKVALLTDEMWYRSAPPRNLDEKAYLIELQSVPGLSGAPVMLQSPQFRVDKEGKFQYRRILPYIIGVVKGLLFSPAGGTQGVAAIEPGSHLREILRSIAEEFKAAGIEIELEPPPTKK
jgi:hypothetical protein